MISYFDGIASIQSAGANSADTMAFHHYDPSEILGGKIIGEHLRFAACYWHNFVWKGNDPFGRQTFERPWFPADTMELVRLKAGAAFEMFRSLGVLYFCFRDHDVRLDGDTLQKSHTRLNKMADYFAKKIGNGMG